MTLVERTMQKSAWGQNQHNERYYFEESYKAFVLRRSSRAYDIW